MNTAEVMRQLLAGGWRYEYLGKAQMPVLTNAPPDRSLCVACGEWVDNTRFVWNWSVCKACLSARQSEYSRAS